MAIDIQPGEGMVAVRFSEEDGDVLGEPHPSRGGPAKGNHACEAECLNVGKKVTVCKAGDVVYVRESERAYAIELDESTCLVNQYAVVATVKR